jgi:hypothetical protein
MICESFRIGIGIGIGIAIAALNADTDIDLNTNTLSFYVSPGAPKMREQLFRASLGRF